MASSFHTLGINIVINGTAQFARNLGFVAASLNRYAQFVKTFDKELVNFARRQYNEAQKNVDNLARSINRQGEAIKRYEYNLKRLGNAITYGNKQLQIQTKVVADLLERQVAGEDVTYQLERAQAKLFKTTDTLNQLYYKQGEATDILNKKKQNLTATTNDHQNAVQKAASTLATYLGAVKNAEQGVGGLSKFFSILTGSYTKNIAANLGMAGALTKLAPTVAAISLALDVFKLGLDLIVFAARMVVNGLNFLWGIVKKIAGIFVNAAKAVGDFVFRGLKALVTFPFRLIASGFSSIADSIKRILEVAIGMNLERVMWGIGQKLREVSEIAFEAASNFQLLQIRLRGLIQRELSETTGNSFASGLAEATKRAEELSFWISNLAVKSIFTAEDISNTFTLAMAYGFTERESKKLTTSILNFSTGMGLTNEQMRRIIENFGQLRNQGKLTGTELRDLARGSFVPVQKILKQMGIDVELNAEQMDDLQGSLKDMVAEGDVSIDKFFDAFITMTEKDFPNALEKASGSFKVIISNIQDFIESVIGWRVLTPILDVVGTRLTKFMNSFLSQEMREIFLDLGAFLGVLTKGFFDLSDSISSFKMENIFALANRFSKFLVTFKEFFKVGKQVRNLLLGYNKTMKGLWTPVTRENLEAYSNVLRQIQALGIKDSTQFIKNFEKIFEGLDKLRKGDTTGFGQIWEGLKGAFGQLWTDVIKPQVDMAWRKFKQSIIDFWEMHGKPALETWWEGIKKSVKDLFENKLPAWWSESGQPWVNEALNNFSVWITSSDNWAVNFAKTVASKLLTMLDQNAGASSQFVQDVGKLLGAGLMAALAVAANMVSGALQGTTEAGTIQVGMGVNNVPQQYQQIINDSVNPLSKAIDALNLSARKALDESLLPFKQWLQDVITPLKPVVDTLSTMWTILSNMVNLGGAFLEFIGGVLDIMSALVEPVTGVRIGLDGINAAIGIFVSFIKTETEALRVIAQVFHDIAAGIRDAQAAINAGLPTGGRITSNGPQTPRLNIPSPVIPQGEIERRNRDVAGGKYGLDMVIPAGYDNDQFTLKASSGERVLIIPKFQLMGANRKNALPTSVINRIFGGSGNTFNSNLERNYNLNVNSQMRTDDIITQFGTMRLLGG